MKRSEVKPSRTWRDAGWWAALLSGYEESDLSIKAYCAAQGISAASFYRWQKRLNKKQVVGFSPIEIATGPVGSLVIELPGGVCLRFSELPPVGYLGSLSLSISGVSK